ncbi:MAG: hypothetical protein HN359_09100 [Actinobacteria bacterium]|nr:hypothetical protein [Actinomycetota bacterium]MDP7549934.1 hypothetical protein [Acidimicrobiales bacterium]MBT3686447.1 hypothetical protein [Actinomycetota bacterium]MBT4279559.1 hypothetical protein [Actinomycetota bacterium]MBT4343984.1 hypothetical protein [Actinomycetota bacterium]
MTDQPTPVPPASGTFQAPSPVSPDPYRPPQVEAILRQAREVVASARPMPLSTSSMINKDELLNMLDEAVARLPDELRAARWLLKEREEFLAKVRGEGDDILELARSRAERLVQRTEVVRTAEQRARQLLETAREEARRMRRETEDYCDQKLGSFETLLTSTRDAIANGRRRLQETVLDRDRENRAAEAEEAAEAEAARSRSTSVFFDQDLETDEPG